MFYIFERAKREEDIDKYLGRSPILQEGDYAQAYKKQNRMELTMSKIQQQQEIIETND